VKKRTWILLAVALVIIIALAYGWKEYHRQHPDTAGIDAAFSLPAPALLKAFQDDENKSNKQYNDKVVAVSGAIVKIERTDSTQTVLLDAQSPLGGVICQFEPAHNDELKSLHPGQAVTIKGVCTGILMDVILVRCALGRTGN
jgi:preprotein translocase subunit YajC